MARGVNKVILIGNLGGDPEVRYASGSNKAIANVTLATTDTWRDRETNELQERTEWHRVVFFNRLAEIVEQYLKKGSKVYVEGRLQTRKWQDRDGNDRYTTEIVANEMQMLDGRGGGGEGGMGGGGGMSGGGAPRGGSNRSSGGGGGSRGGQDAPSRGSEEPPMPDFDDDIPF